MQSFHCLVVITLVLCQFLLRLQVASSGFCLVLVQLFLSIADRLPVVVSLALLPIIGIIPVWIVPIAPSSPKWIVRSDYDRSANHYSAALCRNAGNHCAKQKHYCGKYQYHSFCVSHKTSLVLSNRPKPSPEPIKSP